MLLEVRHAEGATCDLAQALASAGPVVVQRQFQADGKVVPAKQALKTRVHEGLQRLARGKTVIGITGQQYPQARLTEKCMNRNINLE